MNLKRLFSRKVLANEAKGGFAVVRGPLLDGDIVSPSLPLAGSNDIRNNTVVQIALRWVQTNFIEPPMILLRSGKEVKDSDPFHKVFSGGSSYVDGAKIVQTQTELRMSAIKSLILYGVGIVGVYRDSSGMPIGLFSPSYGTVNFSGFKDQTVDIKLSSGSLRIPRSDIYVMRYLPSDTVADTGESSLSYSGDQVAADTAIARYTRGVLDAPYPSGFISPEPGLSSSPPEEAVNAFVARLSAMRGRAAGKIISILGPLKFTRLSDSPKDMDIQEMATIGEERISALIGIPPIVLGLGAGLDHATYSNYKEARAAATQDFLIPLWRIFDEQFSNIVSDLFGPQYSVHHDTSKVRALIDSDMVEKLYRTGIIDQATAQELLGMPVLPGSSGRFYDASPLLSRARARAESV